jgi:hypothetical protein
MFVNFTNNINTNPFPQRHNKNGRKKGEKKQKKEMIWLPSQ